jgi:pyridoxal phosphate phosphatase PHOSPHO2
VRQDCKTSNDYKLNNNVFSSQDMVLCRRYRGLENRIAADGEKDDLKCQMKYWGGAWEVEEIFGKL